MSLPPLPERAVRLGVPADDWRGAVLAAGEALVAGGAATSLYGELMVRMIEQHGPYVVIAPGLALAHARPGPEVLADGLAVVTLAHPVAFGHPRNDPVSVVLGLAVRTPEEHLTMVAALANAFNDGDAVERIAAARDADAVRAILGAEADEVGEGQ